MVRLPLTLLRFALLLGTPVGLVLSAAAAPPSLPVPAVVSEAGWHVADAASVAASPDGRTIYLGRRNSGDLARRNLIVGSVDAGGVVTGEPRAYLDSEIPLPEKAQATVSALLPDFPRRKLYLANLYAAATPPAVSRVLTVYDVDAAGEPVGKPRSFEGGNPHHSILALARHPRHNVLYLAGWGGNAVYVYQLDAQGEPQGRPVPYPIGGYGKYELAVSADGGHLYLGTYPDRLEVVELDASGLPTGTPRVFRAGDTQDYLRFQYAPRALYLRRSTPEGERVAVWPLGNTGDPVGEPQVQKQVAASVFAPDRSGSRLWVVQPSAFKDAFSGKPVVDGMRAVALGLGADGIPGTASGSFPPWPGEIPAMLTVPANGRPVIVAQPVPGGTPGNRVRDYRVRATVLEARLRTGQVPQTLPVALRLGVYGPLGRAEQLAVGQPSGWSSADAALKDQRGLVLARVMAGPPDGDPASPQSLAHLKLRIEVAHGDPSAGGKVLQSLVDTVEGGSVLFLMPGYGYAGAGQRSAAIELMSEHARRYLAAARTVGLKPEERPRRFVVSASHMMGGQGHPGQLQAGAEMLALLGFNTVNAYNWGGLAPEEVDRVLTGSGLQRRSMAVYAPPSYFDFDQEKMNPAALDRWAAGVAATARKQNGGSSEGIADFKLADEPGWYYPTMLREVRENPAWLRSFRTYLREQRLQPADLGRTSWDEVFPIGASQAADLPARRLFYWTMRFFPEAALRGHLLAAAALDRAFKRPIAAAVNWNNFVNRWYVASPNRKIGNNPVSDPDSAMGGFDWFQSGRMGLPVLWTEDWFGDPDAQVWSVYADALRSAAAPGHGRFGGYVVGGTLGGRPESGKYRVMSLVGHGAKTIDLYTWGPEPLFPGNCWSDQLSVYRPIAEALRLLGRGERLLFPGRPERGKVALLMPGSSSLWENDSRVPLYFHEMWSLHYALVHAGYSVDYVDEKELADGVLGPRGYTVLYLTEPNVAAQAQEQVREWVRGGGTLVVTPGGGVADEYNTPTRLLDPVLGLKRRLAVRERMPNEAGYGALPVGPTLASGGSAFGAAQVTLRGPISALEPDGAAVAAFLSSGAAGISEHRFGQGRAFGYAFFPGLQYWLTPDRSQRERLPRNWGAEQRRLAVAPARMARTPRAVTVSREGVEACRLQSEKGIAVVLLNWTGEPVRSLTVTVPRSAAFGRVTSLEKGRLRPVAAGDQVTVTLPLESVDVLLVEPGR